MKVYTEVPVTITGEPDELDAAHDALEKYAMKLPKRFDVTVGIHVDSWHQPIPFSEDTQP